MDWWVSYARAFLCICFILAGVSIVETCGIWEEPIDVRRGTVLEVRLNLQRYYVRGRHAPGVLLVDVEQGEVA